MAKRAKLFDVFGLSGVLVVLAAASALAQPASAEGCSLSIEGDGGSSVWVNASGCSDNDTVVIEVSGPGKQHQFPGGQGAEIYQPFNISTCDLGINSGKATVVTYTAVVVSGTDKGRKSAAYNATVPPPPPPPADAPPSLSFSGRPGPGTFVKPADSIVLSVTATDDVGLTYIRVTDPEGHVVLDRRIKPVPTQPGQCHSKGGGQTETIEIPTPYVVPQNPPTPVLKFTAVVRDTAGHETPGVAEYWTEAVWNGHMIVESSGVGSSFVCKTRWNVELWIKTSPENEISGTAEGRHSPPLTCKYASGPDPGGVTSIAVTGTFDGKLFQLHFNVTGGNVVAYSVSGMAGLEWQTPQTVELRRSSINFAKGPVRFSGPGNLGKTTTISGEGMATLTCCFTDAGPGSPAKVPPIFLGEDQK